MNGCDMRNLPLKFPYFKGSSQINLHNEFKLPLFLRNDTACLFVKLTIVEDISGCKGIPLYRIVEVPLENTENSDYFEVNLMFISS